MMPEFIDVLNQCIKNDEGAWNIFVDTYGRFMKYNIKKVLSQYQSTNQDNEVEEILHRIFMALLENNSIKDL